MLSQKYEMAKIVQMGEYHSLFPPKKYCEVLGRAHEQAYESYSVTQLLKKKIQKEKQRS
jgi:hypothetical protein